MSENTKKLTNDQMTVQIPYYLHEGEMERAGIAYKEETERLERLNKRWFVSFLIVLVMLFGSNLAWVIHESQFEDQVISYEVAQDSGEGGQNTFSNNTVRLIGGDDNGEAGYQSDNPATGEENVEQQSENVPNV